MTVNVGERLRALRREAGLSQEQLAALVTARGLNWWQSTVQKVETGQRALTLADVEALAAVYQMSIDDMLYGHDDQDSTTGLPIPDPAREMADDIRQAAERVSRFELQELLRRVAAVRADLQRMEDERREYPGDEDNYEGRR